MLYKEPNPESFSNVRINEMRLLVDEIYNYNNGYVIRYIKNPSDIEEELEAVKYDGRIIQFIDNPTEKQLAVVKENGYAIGWIENPSEMVQLEAIRNNRYAIHYINNPSPKVLVMLELMK